MAYLEYRGRCVGRIMAFMFRMSPSEYERFLFGDGKIYYGYGANGGNGPLLATYTWDEDTDIPILEFTPEFKDKYDGEFSRWQLAQQQVLEHDMSGFGKGVWSESAQQAAKEQERQERKRKLFEQMQASSSDRPA
jgi:hypothetical protein